MTKISLKIVEETKVSLKHSFKMKDLGELIYFLGIEFVRSNSGVVMHQRRYALQLIYEVGLSRAKPFGTHMDVNTKITSKQYDDQTKKNQEEPLAD